MKMLFDLVFILVFAAITQIGIQAASPNLYKNAALKKLLARMKRDTEPTCIDQCGRKLGIKMENIESPELNAWYTETNNATDNFLKLTQEAWKEHCLDVVKPYIECLQLCPNSLWEQHMASDLKFECMDHYDEFYNNFECWKKAERNTQKKCGCKAIDSKVTEKFYDETGTVYDTCDFETFSKTAEEYCKYFVCRLPCEREVTANYCPTEAADLIVHGMLGVVVQKAQISLLMTKRDKFWPDECKLLLKETKFEDVPPYLEFVNKCPIKNGTQADGKTAAGIKGNEADGKTTAGNVRSGANGPVSRSNSLLACLIVLFVFRCFV